MERGKKSGSSFTSDLFGSKDSDVGASSSGIFGSIFALPAKVMTIIHVLVTVNVWFCPTYLLGQCPNRKQEILRWIIIHLMWGPSHDLLPQQAVGNDSLHMPDKEKKRDSGSQSWKSKTAVSESNVLKGEGNFQRSEGKDMGPFYPVENVHPCHYSSSIYYGGQDIYSGPQTAQSTVFTTFNKDGGEDDLDGASRGNWWQGSLYY